jgi:hypothetical protein
MRGQLSVEATKKGLSGKDKGTYINQQVNLLKQERIDQRDEAIEKRSKELETEISEGLKNLKKLSPLETTIDDGILVQDLMIKVLNVHPEKIDLLATESVANKIIKHIKVGDEESKDMQFYEDAKSEVEKKSWMSKPYKNVPEHLIPLLKASYLC